MRHLCVTSGRTPEQNRCKTKQRDPPSHALSTFTPPFHPSRPALLRRRGHFGCPVEAHLRRRRGHCRTAVSYSFTCRNLASSIYSVSIVALLLMSTRSDFDRWIEQQRNCEPLAEADVKSLCRRTQDLLVEEGNVQYIHSPVTICPHPLLPTCLREHLFCGR